MSRRGFLRTGIALLAVSSAAAFSLFWPKPPAPLAPSMMLTICHPESRVRAGDGFAGVAWCLSDPNTPTNIPSVTVIPCVDAGIGGIPWQNIDVFGDNSTSSPGYSMERGGITALVADNGNGTYISMFQVDGGKPCGGGGPGGPPGSGGGSCGSTESGSGSSGGNPDCFDCAGGLFSLGSVDIRFPLGMANEYRSAGMLKLFREGSPDVGQGLGTPDALQYDLAGSFSYDSTPIQVIKDPNVPTRLRQIRTASLLADIVEVTQGSSFTVRMYAPAAIGTQDGQTHIYSFTSNAFREWQLSYDSETLTVVDKIWGGSAMETRATYVYDYATGSPATWTLTTKNASNDVVRSEVITNWEDDYQQNPPTRSRTYTVYNGQTEVYEHTETETAISGSSYRRTSLVVDPNGSDPQTTTWEWGTSVTGAGTSNIVLTGVTRPDGSWTTFSYEYDSGVWTITTTSPWEDGAGDNLSIVRTFEKESGTNAYRITDETAKVGTTIVSRTAWDYAANGSAHVTVESRYVDGSSTLDTTYDWHYADLPGTRYDDYVVEMDGVENPDGTSIVYTHGDSDLSAGTYPSGHSPTSGSTYRVHQAAQYGSSGLVGNQSTQTSTYVDAVGRPWYSETHVWGGSAWAGPIRWTSWLYDAQGRVVETWSNDGSLTETSYNPCCGRTIVDAQGIETVVTRDVLGRVIYASRAGVETEYDYDTPFVTTATTTPVETSSLSSVTVTTVDMHGRPIKVVTDSGTAGALATLYEYDESSSGGEQVTVYSDYPATANSGTANVRDRTTEYFPDGRVQSVSGATVVQAVYDYGYSSTGLSTQVTTGPSGHTSVETTYYDLIGRVDHVDRDGWASSGTSTLTTSYIYDDSTAGEKGRLVKVESTGQPDTLYEYDTLGRVTQTAVDVDDNGSIGTSGSDRISESESTIEAISSQYWSVQKSYTRPITGSDTQVQTSERRTRLTGYTGSRTASFTMRESVSIDKLNSDNTTTATTAVERDVQTRIETTDVPDSSTNASSTYVEGLLTSSTTAQGVTTTYGYDLLKRQITITDARGNVTTTTYDSSNRVEKVEDDDSNDTTYAYYVGGDSGATTAGSGVWPGRVKSITNPGGNVTSFAYTDRGENWRTWGDVPYPTEYGYDTRGRQNSLKTYQGGTFNTSTWPESPGTADETTWTYHDASGLLNRKTYADASHVDYTYTSDGKLWTRTWGRGAVTTYGYTSTGELYTVTYTGDGDLTPDLTYTYDRLGNIATVVDGAGTRTFAYSATTLAPTTESFGTGMFNDLGLVVTQTYEGSGTGLVPGRWSGVKLGTSGDDDQYYAGTYGYDALGRLSTVAGPGLPSGGAEYTYLLNGSAQTGLPEKTNFKDGSENVLAWSQTTYEENRNLIWKVDNLFGDDDSDRISKYEYVNDVRARRQGVVYSGAAFAGGGFIDDWHYNDRNEIIGTDRLSGTDSGNITTNDTPETSVASAFDRRYSYDNIGNRSSSNTGEAINDPNQPAWSYTPNSLNQYTDVMQPTPFNRQTLEYDTDGNITLMFSVGDVDGDGDTDTSDLSLLTSHLGDTCDDIVSPPGHLTAGEFARADYDGDCSLDFAPDFTGMLGGFGSSGAAQFVAFTWDAENRLVQVEPQARNSSTGAINSAARRVNFVYDYRGRRVEKRVYQRDSSDNTIWASNWTERRRFIWNGWLMLRELIETDANSDGDLQDQDDSTRTKNYTWGKDLGGGLESAGGIGGLLAVYDDNETSGSTGDDLAYVYMYDANGNVGQVCDLTESTAADSIVAKYEYDAYGNPTVTTGTYASTNTYRFSTKPWDDETGLGYWGYRYYDPRLGRWMSRDPIEESHISLQYVALSPTYVFVQNSPSGLFDPTGLAPGSPCNKANVWSIVNSPYTSSCCCWRMCPATPTKPKGGGMQVAWNGTEACLTVWRCEPHLVNWPWQPQTVGYHWVEFSDTCGPCVCPGAGGGGGPWVPCF